MRRARRPRRRSTCRRSPASRPGSADAPGGRCRTCCRATEFDPHFVADVDDDGRAVLRFGDGDYGQRLVDVESVDGDVPRRQRPRGQHRRRRARAHRASRSRCRPGWPTIARGPQPAAGDRRRRPRDDRAGAPARAGRVPRDAVPRRHRGRLPTRRADDRRRRGRGRELPLDRQLVHGVRRHRSRRSGRRPTDARGARGSTPTFKQSVLDVARPLPARRLRPRDPLGALRAARHRDPALREAGLLPRRRRAGGRSRPWRARALGTRRAGLFDAANFTFGQPGLPQPHLRRGRGGRGRRLGRRHRSSTATAATAAGELEHGRHPDRRRGRSRGSTTTPATWRTARSPSPREADHEPPTAAAAPRSPTSAGPRSRTGRGCRRSPTGSGTFATFREAILDELARTPELDPAALAGQRRLHDHGDRAVGGRRRRPDLLHRSGSPTRRSSAPRRCATRSCAWSALIDYQLAPGAAATTAARVHARDGRDGADPGRDAGAERAGRRREAAEVRDARAAGGRRGRAQPAAALPDARRRRAARPAGPRPPIVGAGCRRPSQRSRPRARRSGDAVRPSAVEVLTVATSRRSTTADVRGTTPISGVGLRPRAAMPARPATRAYRLGRSFHLFGHDAPAVVVVARRTDPNDPTTTYLCRSDDDFAHGDGHRPTSRSTARYPDLKPGAVLLAVVVAPARSRRRTVPFSSVDRRSRRNGRRARTAIAARSSRPPRDQRHGHHGHAHAR